MAEAEKGGVVSGKLTVCGLVQGIGFRPYIAKLAEKLFLHGTVLNTGGAVEIHVQGSAENVDAFRLALRHCDLPGAQIFSVHPEESQFLPYSDFSIIESQIESQAAQAGGVLYIPPDAALCPRCAGELSDMNNRRFGHPFISCVTCGPRYSIIAQMPYDRENTAMRDFPLCTACLEEYTEPDAARRHAQTIACHDCGPRLVYRENERDTEKDALQLAAERLRRGEIVAVKGIGGFHLACSPFDARAVSRLRASKGREGKPFAVMFPNLEEIIRLCRVTPQEQDWLCSAAAPIVILKLKKSPFAPNVTQSSLYCGCFLPYTPVHVFLTQMLGPLIFTSANRTDEPIIFDDADMFAFVRETGIPLLYHNRKILRPADDSVIKPIAGTAVFFRRSRGFVPFPARLRRQSDRPAQKILAMGGDLKHTCCLLDGEAAYVSPPQGDLEHVAVSEAAAAVRSDWFNLFHFQPQVIAVDAHPLYFSAESAGQYGVPIIKIQHHHAHIASVMAEHDLRDKIIGVAFDGTGYGTDGRIWGGEFLICHGKNFTRAAHLPYVKIIGGDGAAKDAAKTAYCYCRASALQTPLCPPNPILDAALKADINTIYTSGVGRLFDAAAFLTGLAAYNRYEGECAARLEEAAEIAMDEGVSPIPMQFSRETDGVGFGDIFLKLSDTRHSAGARALGFHRALARLVESVCAEISDRDNIKKVALAGGVFQNKLLTEFTCAALCARGFEVFRNIDFPPNDGSISLGQAYLASMN